MSDYPDNPGPLPALRLCNVSTPNPVTGDGALGNVNKGQMYYRGSDREDLVRILQQMLVALGYDVGPAGVDGILGNDTEAAVLAFQENNTDWEGTQLNADGLVGPRTSDALNRKMVGVWYDLYQTPIEFTNGMPLFTATNDAFKDGVSIERGESAGAKIVVVDYRPPRVEPRIRIVLEDFFVLQPGTMGMSGTFEPSDRLVFDIEGFDYEIRKKDGEVFIRPGVLVVGQFSTDYNGMMFLESDAWLRVEGSGGEQKGEEIPVRIVVDDPAVKVEIPMSDQEPKYHIAIVANPGIQETGSAGNDPPFLRDDILRDRPAYHRRVVRILESLFDTAEDSLRDEEVEPYIRLYSLFDNTLANDADNSLLRKSANFATDNIAGPRSIDLPDLLPDFLSRHSERADVVIAVSKLNFRCSAWFTTDGADGDEYSLDGTAYRYGTDVTSPGSFGDSVLLRPETQRYDKLTPIHEYFHAMSEKDRGRIIDLYHDNFDSSEVSVNKRQRSGANIPAVFGRLDSTSYNSDAPNGAYVGRGGLGYPGADGINTTYGPELVDNTVCNVMDNFTRSTMDPDKCKLDHMTHRYVMDRIKAKIRNR